MPGATTGPRTEEALREILGPELDDKFFQLVVPPGELAARSGRLRKVSLPVSPEALRNAARGIRTFEIVKLSWPEPVRLLTMPVLRDGQLRQLIQVGISLSRAHQALRRYREILFVLVPVGVGLAAVGGALIARALLAPVNDMSRSARKISAEDLSLRIPLRGTRDELDHLGQTLNAMLERLENTIIQTRRFAADAAHELRTPLTALKGEIEVALRAPRAAEEYRRVLRSSLEEVDRLIRLAEDLLLLSRASAGLEATRIKTELEPLLMEVLAVGTRLAQGAGVTVYLSNLEPAIVRGHGSSLRRAILNLVENAVKYTPHGGKVELSLKRSDGWASVTVRDTGPGIDPSDAERIFQPFVRLDAARTRQTGGAGLGLAIARSIVLAHAGTLLLENAPGAGSHFIIRLPLA